MRTAIVNGVILTPYRSIAGKKLLICDGVIEGIAPLDTEVNIDMLIDAQGMYVSPGFIDMHVHGGDGFDFMDGTVEAIERAAKAHMRYGTTSIVPTTLTSSDEEMMNVFRCFASAKSSMVDGPCLLGLHLEGPYFSQEHKGAQDARYIRLPKREHYLEILNASQDIISFSAAPEIPGVMEFADALREKGILASIGHSNARYEDVVEALEHGFSHIIHLYSGMSTIRRINAYRHLGVVESAYLLEDLSVEIIADGNHLPPELMRLIVKQKPLDKICLVTDAMRGAGMPEGSTPMLGSLKNGQETVIENGVAMLPDKSAFAGSVCTADRCVRTMVQQVNIPLTDAVRMMTVNPAKVLGISARKGKICSGMDADICIFDENIKVKKVLIGGKLVFSAD